MIHLKVETHMAAQALNPHSYEVDICIPDVLFIVDRSSYGECQ